MSHLLLFYRCCRRYHGVILNTVNYSHKSKPCSLLHIVVSDTLSSVFAALLLLLYSSDILS